jgi:putative membrane protein
MVSALVVSIAFLVSYVTYHALAGSRPFGGVGWIRAVYFPLLISHIVLAAVIVPLALTTVYRALRGDFARHRRIARFTLPIWLYVSVTGVLVYWMLYRL